MRFHEGDRVWYEDESAQIVMILRSPSALEDIIILESWSWDQVKMVTLTQLLKWNS